MVVDIYCSNNVSSYDQKKYSNLLNARVIGEGEGSIVTISYIPTNSIVRSRYEFQ